MLLAIVGCMEFKLDVVKEADHTLACAAVVLSAAVTNWVTDLLAPPMAS